MFDTLRALLAKRLLPKGTQGRRIIPNVDIWDGSSPTSEIGTPRETPVERGELEVPEARQKPAGGAPNWNWNVLIESWASRGLTIERLQRIIQRLGKANRKMHIELGRSRIRDSAVLNPEEPRRREWFITQELLDSVYPERLPDPDNPEKKSITGPTVHVSDGSAYVVEIPDSNEP
jgi:hypothetical protein